MSDPATIEAAAQERLLDHEVDACPVCGSDDTRGGQLSVEEGRAYQSMSCEACDATWTEGYRRVNIHDVELADGERVLSLVSIEHETEALRDAAREALTAIIDTPARDASRGWNAIVDRLTAALRGRGDAGDANTWVTPWVVREVATRIERAEHERGESRWSDREPVPGDPDPQTVTAVHEWLDELVEHGCDWDDLGELVVDVVQAAFASRRELTM